MDRGFMDWLIFTSTLLFFTSVIITPMILIGLTEGAKIQSEAEDKDAKEGLYSKVKDDVIILNTENMKDRVYGKNMAWLIEFYNSWCGHCINFAPSWKQFATDLKGWRRVVSVGAVDCSISDNIRICRDFDIMAYPSIMILPPQFSDDKMKNVTRIKSQDLHELKDTVLDYISNPEFSVPATWPQLSPLQSLGDIWNEVKDEHQFVVVVFEDKNSIVGRQVILDLVDYGSIHVRTMLKENVQKFGILKYPSLYIINKDSSFQHLASGTGLIDSDRHRFVDKMLSMLGLFDKEGRRISLSHNHEATGEKDHKDSVVQFQQPEEEGQHNDTLPASALTVHMQDLESALHYSLHQEVAISKTIDGPKLDALRDFVTVLAKHLPARPEVSHFLWKVVAYLENPDTPLTGETWAAALDSLQDKKAFLPFRVKWVGCQGSQARFRGYPCALWTLFHTLSVNAFVHSNELTVKGTEVPLAMRGYLKHFFGCQECSEHFVQRAATLESEVHTPGEAVVWLWAIHNIANKHLRGDPSEDPQHLKIQFPSTKHCPDCRLRVGKLLTQEGQAGRTAGDWNQTAVLSFLVQLYREDRLVQDADWRPGNESERDGDVRVGGEAMHAGATKSRDELDWWEKKQRQEDLRKIWQLRQQKRKRMQEQHKQNHQLLTFPATVPEKRANGKEARGAYARRKIQPIFEEKPSGDGWGLSRLDIGVCMAFYMVCAIIIIYLYYYFIVHKKFKAPCSKYLPV